jgi:predicted Rossmann fold flavoprotein
MNNKTLVVIGGGAAGFFCAVNAARLHKGLKVILLEKYSKLLSKVKVSGGGRCNVTHACFTVSELIKNYPRGSSFLKKAFHQFNTNHTIEWFNERGISLHTESDGRMFPSTNSSQTIIDCLLNEAQKHGVEIIMNADVNNIDVVSANNFNINYAKTKSIHADFICIACGGFPKSAQFDWFKNLGHTIINPVPSLFTFNIPKNPITELMGVSVPDATVKIMGSKLQQSGPVLITHWGLSGPGVLKLSAWAAIELAEKNYHFSIQVNWLPAYNENTLLEKFRMLRFDIANQKIANRNPFALPTRLWVHFLNQSNINVDIRWADLPAKEQNKLIKLLCSCEFEVKGKTTFKEEFVTAGGIDLSEIDATTLQSKKIPGLYFAGEIINVDGVTGGFNFQNAWTTGWIVGNSVGEVCEV